MQGPLPEEEWGNWWRNVSKEEAARRYRQIRDEGALIRDEWLATREGRSAFAPGGYPQWGGLYSRTFARKFSAPFFAPQQDESEEDFRKRSAEGRAIDRYYQDIFQEQRQDVQKEIEEEEQYRVAA